MNPLPACFYCSGGSHEPFLENVRNRLREDPSRWAYRRCQRCGSAHLFPRPGPGEAAFFYPAVYDFTPEILRQKNFFLRGLARIEYRLFFEPKFKAQARRVVRGTGSRNPAGRRVLDIGCGGGLRLLAFRRYGYRIHGTDFRPEVVEVLKNQWGIPAVCTDAGETAQHFPPASFDLITAFHVLEHVPDVQLALGNCFKLLKPGGWFVAAVPLLDSFQAGLLKSRWAGADAPYHLSLPSREGIRRVCGQAGFEKVSIRPDSVFECAGMAVLSLLRGTATTYRYTRGGLTSFLTSLLAGSLGLLLIPWCLLENHLWRQPASGLVFAHKPG